MDKSYDHTYFHFERILKVKSIFSYAPCTVNYSQMVPKNNFHTKKLIIDESTIDAHKAHKVK